MQYSEWEQKYFPYVAYSKTIQKKPEANKVID